MALADGVDEGQLGHPFGVGRHRPVVLQGVAPAGVDLGRPVVAGVVELLQGQREHRHRHVVGHGDGRHPLGVQVPPQVGGPRGLVEDAVDRHPGADGGEHGRPGVAEVDVAVTVAGRGPLVAGDGDEPARLVEAVRGGGQLLPVAVVHLPVVLGQAEQVEAGYVAGEGEQLGAAALAAAVPVAGQALGGVGVQVADEQLVLPHPGRPLGGEQDRKAGLEVVGEERVQRPAEPEPAPRWPPLDRHHPQPGRPARRQQLGGDRSRAMPSTNTASSRSFSSWVSEAPKAVARIRRTSK